MPSGSAGPPDTAVVDPTGLRALASPARFALFSHLVDHGPRTATQCAGATGLSPSNCSWHLRALARAGLVERVPGDADARHRPWRTTAERFDLSGGDSPSGQRMATDLDDLLEERSGDLHRQHRLERDALTPEWRAASGSHHLTLQVTAQELEVILEQIHGVVATHRRSHRSLPPVDAETVVLSVTAFPHPHRSMS